MAELRPNMTPYFGVYKSLFKFGGLPAPLTPDVLVSLIFYNEYVAWTRIGTAVVAGTVSSWTKNIYGEPGAEMYVAFTNSSQPQVRRKREEVVILDMSIGEHYTPYRAIYDAAKIVEEIDLAIKLNIKAHQIPSLWGVSSKEMKTELERLLDKIRANVSEAVIIDASSALLTALHSIKADTPYIVDKLQAAKAQAKSELYALMGVNYAALQKVSNTVVDEVNANATLANVVYENMLGRLKKAFDEINTQFGTNMTVEPAIESPKPEAKGAPNGEEKEDPDHGGN